MSTNKTQNYNLHKWEADDDFLRTEFNENFAKLDEEAAHVAVGAYVGDGAVNRTFELGFTPAAVLLADAAGNMHTASTVYGGLAVRDHPLTYSDTEMLEIVEGGFIIRRGSMHDSKYYADPNYRTHTYYYIAIRA